MTSLANNDYAVDAAQGEALSASPEAEAHPVTSRIALLMDAACPIPKAYLDLPFVHTMPVRIKGYKGDWDDHRDFISLDNFYRENPKNHVRFKTVPTSQKQVSAALRHLVPDFSSVFIQTITSARSPTFNIATEVSNQFGREEKGTLIKHKKDDGRFRSTVYNTGCTFAGQALAAIIAIKRLRSMDKQYSKLRKSDPIKYKANLAKPVFGFSTLRKTLVAYQPYICGYFITDQSVNLAVVASKKGDRSVKRVGATISDLIGVRRTLVAFGNNTKQIHTGRSMAGEVEFITDEIVAVLERQVDRGYVAVNSKLKPIREVVVAYAGNLEEIERQPHYIKMKNQIENLGYKVHLTMAAASQMVNVGRCSLSIGLVMDPAELSYSDG